MPDPSIALLSEVSERQKARRAGRFAARYTLWDESSIDRVRACGRHAFDPAAGVQVRVRHDETGSHAAFAGAVTCGSVWACPVCSEKIQAERQREVQAAVDRALARGWLVAFATFTVRHHKGAGRRLDRVWGAASAGWRAAGSGSGKVWKHERQEAGMVGYLRLFETTEGRANGWHVHVHALLFFDPARSMEGMWGDGLRWRHVEAFGRRMFDRWRDGLADTPYQPSVKRGFDIRPVHAAEDIGAYFSKGVYSVGSRAASYEVTSSHAKQPKNGNRTPFGLLADLVKNGDADDLDLWHEWERVSKGKRQMLWSQGRRCSDHKNEVRPREDCARCVVGVRQLLGLLADERTDEEIAAEAVLQGEVVDWVSPGEYRRLVSRRLLGECLAAAEHDDGGERLCAFLNAQGPPIPV